METGQVRSCRLCSASQCLLPRTQTRTGRENQQFWTCFQNTQVLYFSPRFTHSSNRTFLAGQRALKEKGKYFYNWIFESHQTPHHRHRFRLMIAVLVYYLPTLYYFKSQNWFFFWITKLINFFFWITKLIITFSSFFYIYIYLTNNAFQVKIKAYLKPCSPLHFSTSTDPHTLLCVML